MLHPRQRDVILLGRCDVVADRAHVAVGADQELKVADGVGEADVLEREHVGDLPKVFERLGLQLVDVLRVLLMHQRK